MEDESLPITIMMIGVCCVSTESIANAYANRTGQMPFILSGLVEQVRQVVGSLCARAKLSKPVI